MNDSQRIPEATELVYVPEPSWIPFFVGGGIAAILLGLFTGWVWAAAGAVVLLGALIVWIRSIRLEGARMPRAQKISSAVIPAIPPKGRDS
jgi:hypothetical protein